MSDRHIIVCSSTTRDPVLGSRHLTCAYCPTRIWVAPSSLATDGTPVCFACAQRLIDADRDEVVLMPVTPEQEAEIVMWREMHGE
jgi:hypothetical protein